MTGSTRYADPAVDGPTDVLVVGGGLIGAVLALGLAKLGRCVTLVDRARPQPVMGTFGMDIRNIACSPGSQDLLAELGLWSVLDATPYSGMRVWEERGVESMSFDAADVGRTELGWILENGPTVDAAWAALERNGGIRIVLGEVTGLGTDAAGVCLDVGENQFRAPLLIGVDGARSAVRSLVDAKVETRPTGHHALATLVRTERPHQSVALQRFLLDGPLALLPSRDPHTSSVVWSQPPAAAKSRLALSCTDFADEIGRAIEHKLGAVLAIDRRVSYPLQQHIVKDFNPASRVLLIGDAARVLHPLAGLGANVGFEDVRDLLTRFSKIPPGADPGAEGLWRSYARRRRIRGLMMVSLMAGFKQAYGDADPLTLWMRNSTVGALNRARPLKQQLIREALGLGPMAAPW